MNYDELYEEYKKFEPYIKEEDRQIKIMYELLIKQSNNINIKPTPKKEGNYNQNLTRISKNSPSSTLKRWR